MTAAGQQRPMRADARRNRERVLSEARDAFLEYGADAPLEDIAKRAGVGIGTLYRHFPTRLELQEAVYSEQVRELSSTAYTLAETLPPGEALAAWMRAFASYALTKRGLMQTLKAVIDRHSELFDACHTEIRSAVGVVLGPAQEAGCARKDVDVTDLLRLTHGLAVASEYAPQDTDRLLNILLDGLRPQI